MGTYKKAQRKKYATVGDDGYPIGDKNHARLALSRIDQGGLSPDDKAKVRRKAAKFGAGTGAKPKKGSK